MLYLGTTGCNVIHQILSRFLRGRGWRARLCTYSVHVHTVMQNLFTLPAVMKCIIMIKTSVKIVKRSRDGGAKSMHTGM